MQYLWSWSWSVLLVAAAAISAVPLDLTDPTDPSDPAPAPTEEADYLDLSLFTDRDDLSTSTTETSTPRLKEWSGWMYRAMTEGMLRFSVKSQEPKCSRDGQLYRQHLSNLTLWATKMLDASALSPNGFVSADTYQFGHFDDCVAIEDPEDGITGKYCLATINYRPDPAVYPGYDGPPSDLFKELPAHASVWDRLKYTKDPRVIRRDSLHWAVCVPSSCGAQDIQDSLGDSLSQPLHDQGILANVSIHKDDCYSIWEEPPFSLGYFIVMGLMYFVGFLCLIATMLDYATTNQMTLKTSTRRYIKVFSTYTNIRKLFKSNPQADFKLLHCLKYFSMQCVILGHKEMYLFGRPVQNSYFIENFSYHVSSMMFLNGGGYIVDTFFVFSGFLTCHFLTKELEKGKRVNLFLLVVGRIARILPVYLLVIAFHASVLPYLGSGPLWNSLVWREAIRCQKNWWVNVLFLNNYVNAEETCMIQAWYLACDMHFFIIGIILVYIKYKYPKFGNFLLAGVFAAAVAIPTYITYINQYKGVVQLYHELQQDPVKSEHFRTMYIPSHVRFIPYMVGVYMAYLYHYLDRINFKVPKAVLFVLIPFGVIVNISTTLTAYFFYIEERPYSLFENVLYAGIHRIIWAVTISVYIVIDSTCGIGKWGSFFRHPAWAPLGRLSYCAFLVHTLPMLYTTGQMRATPYNSRTIAAMTLLGEVAMSYLFALCLNMLFESPWQRLQKLALNKLMGNPKKSGLTQQNIAHVVNSQLTLTSGISKISLSEECSSKSTGSEDSISKITFRDENGVFKR